MYMLAQQSRSNRRERSAQTTEMLDQNSISRHEHSTCCPRSSRRWSAVFKPFLCGRTLSPLPLADSTEYFLVRPDNPAEIKTIEKRVGRHCGTCHRRHRRQFSSESFSWSRRWKYYWRILLSWIRCSTVVLMSIWFRLPIDSAAATWLL